GRPPRRFVHADDQRLARDVAQHLAGQPRGRQARGNHTEGGEGRAHGNVRRVRKSAARASPPAPAAGANGRSRGWVRPARANGAVSRASSVRRPRRAPVSRRLIEAGTVSGGIQFRTAPSAISPASSSISGPSAARKTRTGSVGGGAVSRKFFTLWNAPSTLTRSPAATRRM